MRCGRYFLHEHPQTASSWNLPCMKLLEQHPMVLKAKVHMCQFGMTATDEAGTAPVKKPTIMMTNSVELHRELDRQCTPGSHRHVQLMSGRAKDAAIYPKGLCRAVCRGAMKQMDIYAAEFMSVKCVGEQGDVDIDALEQEPDDLLWMRYWDDTNGKELRADLVKEARAEEISEVRKMGVWRKVPRSECLAETGRPPIKLRWIDRNKKDNENPKYRSRIVAKEIKTYSAPE